MLQRLDKFLTSQGVCTRSEAGKLCRRGRVTVDGKAVTDPSQKVDPDTAAIALDGRALTYKEHLYIMMNQPAGILCVSRDPKARTVLDLLPPELCRRGLFPAGRLDKDTTGFVFITDDGDLAHRMLAPKSHVPKRYEVRLDAPLAADAVALFAAGVTLEDGSLCAPSKLQQLSGGDQPLWEITITEGKYHQIKRMFGTLQHKVLGLHRTTIGNLSLDPSLAPGECREMTAAEVASALEKP